MDVARVWAGHPLRFALLTHADQQYVSYYDAQRQLKVAQRTLGSHQWRFTSLPVSVGWDSHNYVVMAVDADGQIHLAANMHVVPLIYFRTTIRGDASTLVRHRHMVGDHEDACTYPRFLKNVDGKLVFFYRDGSSGDGADIGNVYDESARKWLRLLAVPLLDGRHHRPPMSAYSAPPKLGPDGYFHLVWVWRDTPDARTNHTLSYARSKDLVRWETSAGDILKLPIIPGTGEIVDPVTCGSGIMNGNVHVGFDRHNRAVISYHKDDTDHRTQIFNARREKGRWRHYQTSHWDYRWEIGGYGSLIPEIRVFPVHLAAAGALYQEYWHLKYGAGVWKLDESEFRVLSNVPTLQALCELDTVQSDFPNMVVHWANDLGIPQKGEKYLLRWETLPPNKDQPRTEPLPAPTMLQLVRLRD